MLKWPAEVVKETVNVAEEDPHRKYGLWLNGHIDALRFCRRHQKTRLVADLKDHRSGIFESGVALREFKAAFFCPACRCAYALCPPEFHESSFENFNLTTKERVTALAIARSFVNQVNRHGCGFALFVGTPGTGKTRLACNIIGQVETLAALYIRQGELISALRATYGCDRYEYDAQGKRYLPDTPLQITQATGLLVLDEIGCTSPANDERMLLDELLKHRYERHKPTILISNLPLDQLKDLLGHALTDRIYQATGNGKFILQFSGESYRRGAGDKYLRGPD